MLTHEEQEASNHIKRAKQMIGFRREKLSDPNCRDDMKYHLKAEIEALEYMMEPVEQALQEKGITVEYDYVPISQRQHSRNSSR